MPENTRAELLRHLARLRVVRDQIRAVEQERLRKLAASPAGDKGSHAMVRLIAGVLEIGIETADMLVNEVLLAPSRRVRRRRALLLELRQRLERRSRAARRRSRLSLQRLGANSSKIPYRE